MKFIYKHAAVEVFPSLFDEASVKQAVEELLLTEYNSRVAVDEKRLQQDIENYLADSQTIRDELNGTNLKYFIDYAVNTDYQLETLSPTKTTSNVDVIFSPKEFLNLVTTKSYDEYTDIMFEIIERAEKQVTEETIIARLRCPSIIPEGYDLVLLYIPMRVIQFSLLLNQKTFTAFKGFLK